MEPLTKTAAPMGWTAFALLSIWTAACGSTVELVRPAAPQATALLFRDVTVLEMAGQQRLEHQDLLVRDGRIVSIGPTGESVPGAQVIEGAGATLLPGLVDAHTHLSATVTPAWDISLPDPAWNLQAYLFCGVTTVLEAGGPDNEAVPRRDAVAEGELLGPRVFTAGPVLTAVGGHPLAMMTALVPWYARPFVLPHLAREIARPEEANEVVEEVAALGVDFIKVALDSIPLSAPKLDESRLEAIVAAARTTGLRTVAHIGTTDDALVAGRAGASLWLHGVYKERIADAQIAQLASFGIPMVPTVAVFDSYAIFRGPRPTTALERQMLPAEVLESYNHPPDDLDLGEMEQLLALIATQRQNWSDNLRRLHAAGVPIFVGTDAQPGVIAGAAVHREMQLLHEAGLSNWEVLRAATLLPAQFLAGDQTPSFGNLVPGMRADLLLVEGDPTVDLTALAEIRAVVTNGVLLDRTPATAGD